MVSQDIIDRAIYMFQPVIYLDSRSNYFPIDFDDYISESKLKSKITGRTVSNYLSPESFGNMLLDNPGINSEDYTLFLPNKKKSKVFNKRKDLNRVPLYTHVIRSSQREFYIQYIHMYAYNGSTKIGCFNFGSHYADKEHITVHVRLNHLNILQIKRVYYAKHSGGYWLGPNEVDYEDTTHPVVYSAYHSHSSNESSRTRYRFGCLTRDICDKGHRWYSTNIVRIPDTDTPLNLMWTTFRGDLGDGHVSDFASSSWWNIPDVDGHYQENWCF